MTSTSPPRPATELSPFTRFTAEQWGRLRADAPMTLSQADLDALRGLNEPVSLAEVERIYLPLARLLSLHVRAARRLYERRADFLGDPTAKVPFVVGLAGSVAVGKSTTARILQALLERGPRSVATDLVTTDGFLLPNAELSARGLMDRKGFPESYDRLALITFLSRLKSGDSPISVPVYSHVRYDVVADDRQVVDAPEVVIVEGLNVLQPPAAGTRDHAAVSDFFDFSLYVDADEADVRRWYVERFLQLRTTAFRQPDSHFRAYAALDVPEAEAVAQDIWTRINGRNLRRNIRPTRGRADLILHKTGDHHIDWLGLRKL